MYSEQQTIQGHEMLRDMVHFFGYASEDPTSETNFFKYDYKVPANKEALKNCNGFKAFNKAQMEAMRLRAEDK